MKNLALIIFLLFFIPFSANAKDESLGVAVKVISPKLVETEPGKIITGSFSVYSNLPTEENFIEEINIPEGWQSIISHELPFKLMGKEKQVRIFAFLVPANYPAGRYQIKYTIRSQRYYGITDSTSFSVEVLPVAKLEILIEDKPEVVVAGEDYQARLRLINRGNSKTQIKLEIKGNCDYPVKIEPSEATLQAGKSQILRIEAKTDEKLNQRFIHILEVKAEAEGLKNGAVSVRQTVSVEIIPRITGEFDPYNRLPAQIQLVSVGEDARNGFQVQFSGSGTIDQEKKKEVSFLFRGPDTQDKGIYGERDEYRFSYQDELLALHFGDRGYSLSPLTERYSYGRGAEVDVHSRGIEFGSFYSQSRWVEPEKRETGTYLEYQLNDKLSIRGNFLDKFSSDFHDNIYSIQAGMKSNETALDLEYGLSESQREGRYSGNGYRANLEGNLFKYINYSFEKIYAEPKFFGYYNDCDYLSGTIAFPIYQRLLGNFSYHDYKNNLDLNPTEGTAKREKYYLGDVSYSFPFGTNVSLGYEGSRAEDCLLSTPYDYWKEALVFGLGQAFYKFNFQAFIKRGEFENKLSNCQKNGLEEYNIYAYFQPNQSQTYSLYTIVDHTSFTATPERRKNAGISAKWNIKHNISFDLNYQKNNFDSEKAVQGDNIFSSFIYTMPFGHSLSLRGCWFKSEEKKETEFSYSLIYTIPWNIPVSKRRDIGTIKGKVYDGEKLAKMPIKNVILFANGATAVTDKNGNFIFPSLKPGTYSLWVDKKSIGLNRVTSEKLPITLEIKGGETIEIEIGVVTSCRISGRIIAFAFKNNKNSNNERTAPESKLFLTGTAETIDTNTTFKEDLMEAGGLGNVLVEINNEKEVLQQLTDENGKFSFEGMRPGKWNLKIYENDWSADHYLEKNEFQIELKPGEENEIMLRALPRLRQIQILEKEKIKENLSEPEKLVSPEKEKIKENLSEPEKLVSPKISKIAQNIEIIKRGSAKRKLEEPKKLPAVIPQKRTPLMSILITLFLLFGCVLVGAFFTYRSWVVKKRKLSDKNLKLMENLSKIATNTEHKEEILDNILRAFMQAVEARSGALFTVEDKTGDLILGVGVELKTDIPRNLRFDKDSSVFAEISKITSPVFAAQTLERSTYDNLLLFKEKPASRSSFLLVPLIYNNRNVGVVLLNSKRGRRNYLREHRGIIETLAGEGAIIAANIAYNRQVIIDGLTGLYVHWFFYQCLEKEISRAERQNLSLAVLMVDIDHFKRFNDTYGHLMGDKALVKVSEILRNDLRDMDTVARYGGEEFAIILPGVDEKLAFRTAERIRISLESYRFKVVNGKFRLTLSIGISIYEKGLTAEKMVERADKALYWVKQHGRNQVKSWGSLSSGDSKA
jgi:diguanylate cyclase (GGDEF)-like protein